jgi:hypothetical protein
MEGFDVLAASKKHGFYMRHTAGHGVKGSWRSVSHL